MNGVVNPTVYNSNYDYIDSKIIALINLTQTEQHNCWDSLLRQPSQLPVANGNPFFSLDRFLPVMTQCADGFRSSVMAVLVRRPDGSMGVQHARMMKFFNQPGYVWRNDKVLETVIGWKPLG